MTSTQALNAARRAELAGPAGLRGVLHNPRLFRLVACTTLGTLCYGASQRSRRTLGLMLDRKGYEQGAYSQVLVMAAFTHNPKFARIANDASYKGWSVS